MMLLLASVLAINLSGCLSAWYLSSTLDENPEDRPPLEALPGVLALDFISIPVLMISPILDGIKNVGRDFEPMPADAGCPNHQTQTEPSES